MIILFYGEYIVHLHCQWKRREIHTKTVYICCLLYTSDAADDMQCVDLGGRRIIKKGRTRCWT